MRTSKDYPISPVPAIVLGALLALGHAAATPAGDDPRQPSATVRFSDLNLDTAQGAKELYGRITTAAYGVCRSFGRDRYDNADLLSLERCRKQAVAEAVARINKPALNAIAKPDGTERRRYRIAAASNRP